MASLEKIPPVLWNWDTWTCDTLSKQEIHVFKNIGFEVSHIFSIQI